MSEFVAEFRAARNNPHLAVLEGFHALKHALRFGAEVIRVAAVEPRDLEVLATSLAPDLVGRFVTLAERVPAELFRKLTPTPPRTEALAIARRTRHEIANLMRESETRSLVYLEDPRNLGNLGAVIRVAAAADAAGVIASGSHDPWDPAAIRGSAGLHYAVPVVHADVLPESDWPLVAVDPDGESIWSITLPRRSVFAFGTERHGLSDAILSRASQRVCIPMRHGVSSLNLATAVAVLLFGSSNGRFRQDAQR